MRLSAFYVISLVLAPHLAALPADIDQRLGLDVVLSQIGNTRIKAVVKNTGQEVTYMHLNFFGDSAPVKKVAVYQNNTEIVFEGIKRRIRLQGITSEALTTLRPGQTTEDEFDIAATSDLSRGGFVSIRSQGLVPLIQNKTVSGYLPYYSNDLRIEVDAIKASRVSKVIKPLQRRTRIQCTDPKLSEGLKKALSSTTALANAAAKAARYGSAQKFHEYFKTTNASVRAVVAARLQAVAKEANSTAMGATSYYCTDEFGYCESNVLAYTIPSQNTICNCALYYSYLPNLTKGCHNQDRATTSLHEFTHAPGVYSPGTEDLAYGYLAAMGLNSREAVMNADTYAVYANGKSEITYEK
ncbi:hypothetical protein N7456_012743 [Penicillium angulare]|uniref:Neutral protease 2 n=1 Tax=Penicillium angulare TaxID=116970 RepID=A0A9W9EK52_9EURO|nr:hypothetical protein N7456_012743 [Penicillium angulare]